MSIDRDLILAHLAQQARLVSWNQVVGAMRHLERRQAQDRPIELGRALIEMEALTESQWQNLVGRLRSMGRNHLVEGYKIVRVPFANGRPLGYYENFATGFWFEGTERAVVWGRPAGLAVAADGSLLIADDTAQSVWRISYAP